MHSHWHQRARDFVLAATTIAALGWLSLSVDAQNRRFDPAGTYAIDVDGSPGVLSIRYNVTPNQPTQPQAPSGLLEEEGIYLGANNCVSQPHAIAPGRGVWRASRNGRSIQGRTLHAVTDSNGRALGFSYQKVIWTIKIEIEGFVGGAQVEYYDSLQNLRGGLPVCTSHSMDIQGWATFPSS